MTSNSVDGPMGRLLTLEELNDKLNLPRGSKYAYQQIFRRTLPFRYVRIGKFLRFPENEVENYLAKQLQSCR